MLLTGIIMGAIALTAGTLLAAYINEVVSWLKRAINKIRTVVSGLVYGCKVFVKKISEGVKEISKHYSKEGTIWTETIASRTISESEVPDEILQKATRGKEYDITDMIERELAV